MNAAIGALLAILGVLLGAIYLYVYQPFKRKEPPRQIGADSTKNSPNPKKQRKPRRTREQIEEDERQLAARLRERFSLTFERDREQALYAGSTGYIWRSSGDGDVCSACARKNGKRFRWTETPKGGHPGTFSECDVGYCRCFVEPIFPRD